MPLLPPGFAQGLTQSLDDYQKRQLLEQQKALQQQALQAQQFDLQQKRASQAQALRAQQALGLLAPPPVTQPQTPAPGQPSMPQQAPPPQMPAQGPLGPQSLTPQTPQALGQPRPQIPPYRTVNQDAPMIPPQQPQGMQAPPQLQQPAQPQSQGLPSVDQVMGQLQAKGVPLQDQLAVLQQLAPIYKMKSEEQNAQLKQQLEVIQAALGIKNLQNVEAPKMRTRVQGDQEIQEQFNPKTQTWEQIGQGPRFARQVAPVVNINAPGAGGGKPDEGAAAQASTGMPINQIVPGYGKDASAKRQQVRQDAIKMIMKDLGLSQKDAGIELANRTIQFQAGRSTDVQLSKMEGATRQAVSQLDFNIKKVNQELAKLKSSDLSPVINAIIRGEQKWTGEPAYSGLFYFMSAAAQESARILSGGQASVAQLQQGAREEAKKWADVGMTPAAWKEVSDGMLEEGQARIKSFSDARSQGRVGAGSRGKQDDTDTGNVQETKVIDGITYKKVNGKWMK